MERRPLWVRTPIDFPILALLLWILISIPFAVDPTYSFREWRKLLAGVLSFYWATMVLRSHPGFSLQKRVLGILTLGVGLLSAYAVADFLDRGGSWKDRMVRAGAPSSDYNWLSTYVVLTFPVLVATAYVVKSWKVRSAVVGVSLLGLLAQVMTYTRAGWLAMVVEAALFSCSLRRRALWVVTGVVVGLVAIGLAVLVLTGFQAETTSTNTFYYRLATWNLMLEEIAAHPLVGVGYGNGTFMLKFGGTVESHNAGGAHNLFMMVAMGSGLPAVVFLTWLFAVSVRTIWSGARSTAAEQATLLIGLAIAVVGFIVRNLFDHMLIGTLGYLFWIMLANGIAGVETVQRSQGSSVDGA
jgi:O-antigen ligase